MKKFPLLFIFFINVVFGQQWSIGDWTPRSTSVQVSAIQWDGLTHVVQGKALVNSDGTLDITTYAFTANASNLVAAAHASNVKALVGLGQPYSLGQTMNFQEAVTNHSSALISNIMNLVNAYGFDGIDVGWAPFDVGSEGSAMESLLKDLRAALGTRVLIADAEITDYGYWVSVVEQLDRINLLTYGMGGPGASNYSWYNAALYSSGSGGGSVDATVLSFLASGIPADKLTIGIPFYGIEWSGGGITGPYEHWGAKPSLRQFDYREIVPQITAQSFRWDSAAQVPYLTNNAGNTSFLSYDDEQSVAAKVNYAKTMGLGGWKISEISRDYVPDGNPRHPLMTALRNTIGVALSIVSSSALPGADLGASYSQTLAATGLAPITWTVTSGMLPGGLSLSSSTGVLRGTPTSAGVSTFTITAANALGNDSKQMSLTVSSPATHPSIVNTSSLPISQMGTFDSQPKFQSTFIRRARLSILTTSPLPVALSGTAYSQTLAATGTTPITWSVTSGALPTGFGLGSSTGIISGTPSATGIFTFTVTATNAVGGNSKQMSLTVSAPAVPPSIVTTSPLLGAVTGTSYSQTVAASGTTPITWSVTSGALPAGLGLGSSTGIISGTPSATDTFTFTVTATNAVGSNSKQMSLTVSAPAVPPSIVTTSPLLGAVTGTSYSQTVAASGTTPITWSVTSGALPAGLGLGSSTGIISGTPSATDTFTFTVTATNAVGSNSKQMSLTVSAPAVPPSIVTTSPLLGAVTGTSYSQTVAASGTTPITWSVTSGALPAGLGLGSSTGIISGTPSATDTFTFTVTATNAVGSNSKQMSLTVSAPAVPPSIVTTSPLLGAVTGTSYSQTVAASGTTPITWSVTSGALPAGLGLGSSTGIISGTPSATGIFTFTVTATNAVGSNSKQMSLTVSAPAVMSAPVPPSIVTTSPLLGAVTGTSYSQTVAASGTTPITWSVTSGALPAGLGLGSSTGIISGTPSATGIFTFTVIAANGVGSNSKQMSLTVSAPGVPPSIVTTSPLLSAVTGTSYSQTVAASGTTPITWSVTSGALPAGLGLGSSTGIISGTPSATGIFTFTVTAANAVGSNSKQMSLTVASLPATTFTYYVDSANGSDSNPGTQALPWKTIAKVNSTKLMPGQSVGFARGGVWRGETLTPGQSGTAENPIMFGAYGTGALPQILGSVAASTAGAWEVASAPFSVSGSVIQANMKLSIAAGKAFADFNAMGSLTSYVGGLLTITDSGGHTLTGYISAAGTGETYGSQLLPNPSLSSTSNLSPNKATLSTIASGGQVGGPYLEVALSGAYGGGLQSFGVSNGILLKGSAYLEKGTETSGMWLELANQSWTNVAGTSEVLPGSWKQYTVYGTADSTSSMFELSFSGATLGQTSLFDTASVVQVLTPSTTGVTILSQYGGSTQNWASEQAGFNRNDSNGYTYTITASGSLPNRWKSTVSLSTEPNAVFRDNVPLTLVASPAAVSNTSQYYYSNGVAYVYATGNPTAAGDSFEITQGTGSVTSDALVNLNNLNYVTLNNLNLEYANLNGILVTNSSNVVVNGVDASCTWGTGIQNLGWSYDYSSFITVENSVFNWNGAGGIRFAGGGGGSAYGQLHDLVIQGNSVTYAGWETTITSTTGGIYVWGVYGGPSVSYNATIQNNNVSFTQFGPGNTGNAAGIYMDEWGTGGVIQHNSSHDNAGPGILFEHQNGNAAYYNLLWNNATSPSAFQFQFAFYRTASNMVGANNTCYGGVNCYGVVGQNGTGQAMIGNTLENNIAIGYSHMALQAIYGGENAAGGSGNTYSHNDFGLQTTGFIGWGQGTFYGTYSAWEAAMGRNSYSVEEDPLLTNPPTDMALQPASPAIGAGFYISGVSTANPPNIGAE